MATIGRFEAVVSWKGLRIRGLLGWLMWLVVHITFLTGFANRLSTLLHWGRSFLGRSRSQLAYSARFAQRQLRAADHLQARSPGHGFP